MSTFERDGIRLAYPENWDLQVEAGDDGGWIATIQSPDTAFLLLSLQPAAGDPAELADQTLETLKAEYTELDAENRVETLAGRLAIGHDIDFLTLDASVLCRTRCLDTLNGPLLLMTQVSEYDRDIHEPVLQAMAQSLTIDEE
jgi:hypothetical protein